MKLPEIETARLRLRPFTPDDVDGLYCLWIDRDVRRYLWDDEVIPRERVATLIDESLASFGTSGFGLWAVFPYGEYVLVGFCGFWHFHDPPHLELLYGIAPAYWNRGFATEIASAMIRYGFDELGFERIDASTDAPNRPSIRVMEKAGMKFEKRVDTRGFETVYYSIWREAFEVGESL
jgi:ribosomal-protein-alanine N-acetyltransferase